MTAARSAAARGAAFCFVLLLCLALFFRIQIATGFTWLFSDRSDGAIEIAILEHWYNVVRGLEHWSNTNYFYPAGHGIGYNDGYFLYGLIYAVPRALGADPYISSELVNAVLRVIGFAGMFAFLRLAPRLEFTFSLFGAALFAISDNMAIHAHHEQLLSVGFAPVAGLLLVLALRGLLGARQRRLLWAGLGFAVLMSAWFLTAYYMAWFFGLFLLVCAPLWLVLAPPGARRALLAAGWRARAPLAAIVLVQAATLVPFLWIYVPLAAMTGGHDFAEVLQYGLLPVDLTHVGPENLLWSKLDGLLIARYEPGVSPFSEHTTGMPVLLLALFLIACCWLASARDAAARLVRLLALAAVVVWLLAVQFGDFTLWRYVFHYVPGARGLRVVSRIQIALAAPVIVTVAFLLARLSARTPALLMLPLCAMLVVEEVNLGQPVSMDRPAERAFLRSVRPPPPGCQVFYASAARPGLIGDQRITDIYSHNVDAMLVAELDHIPTLNGFSTFTPADWNFVAPEAPDYAARVARYVRAHDIHGLCAVDFSTGMWRIDPLGTG
jgi:hypothetical protein